MATTTVIGWCAPCCTSSTTTTGTGTTPEGGCCDFDLCPGGVAPSQIWLTIHKTHGDPFECEAECLCATIPLTPRCLGSCFDYANFGRERSIDGCSPTTETTGTTCEGDECGHENSIDCGNCCYRLWAQLQCHWSATLEKWVWRLYLWWTVCPPDDEPAPPDYDSGEIDRRMCSPGCESLDVGLMGNCDSSGAGYTVKICLDEPSCSTSTCTTPTTAVGCGGECLYVWNESAGTWDVLKVDCIEIGPPCENLCGLPDKDVGDFDGQQASYSLECNELGGTWSYD